MVPLFVQHALRCTSDLSKLINGQLFKSHLDPKISYNNPFSCQHMLGIINTKDII
jgi:hypothetical protein